MRPSVIVATLLASLLLASPTLAQDAPPDLPTPPPAPFVVPAANASATAEPPAASSLVRVELPHMERHGKLEVFDPRAGDEGDDASWHPLCPSPCADSVPVGTRLRVNGDFRESASFVVQDRPTMRLVVHPARSGVRLTGILLASGGASIATLSALHYRDFAEDGDTRSAGSRLTRADVIGFGLFGAAVMGVGIGLAAWHWKTRVTIAGSEAYGVPIAKGVWLGAGGVRF